MANSSDKNCNKPQVNTEQAKAANNPTKVTPVRLAIALVLSYPNVVSALPNEPILQHLELPGIPLLNKLIELCQQKPDINSAQLLEYFRGSQEGQQLSKLMCWQHNVLAENAENTFLDTVEKLLSQFHRTAH